MVISIEGLTFAVGSVYSLLWLYVLCHLDKISYKRFISFFLLTILVMAVRFHNEILNLAFVALVCVALVLIIFFKKPINKT
ncbi:hypothetical protein [Helicobacter mesocricetorum]|uniref:hypothetical protein n=1 Tax=Helicobacter mesocricetorum TaxID=87012 RepID=UPI000CF06E90|nr:hypothetical protein [Helicobacter mesocricetorum]